MFKFWLIALGLVAIFVGWKVFTRSGYESAAYRLLKKENQFELREYPDLVMATTPASFSSQGKDGSFMRLFRYISGQNASEKKIAMTTPVFMDPQRTGEMSFVLPKSFDMKSAPAPADSKVQITRRESGRYAVVRFSGWLTPQNATAKEEALRKWIQSNGWQPSSEAEAAGYDPPFTPGPFRRNEILIRLK